MNKLFFSPTYCNFAHYNQLQTATSKLQSIISPLTSTCHDGALGPLSGRLKQLLQSGSNQTLLYFKIFTVFMLATLFTTSNSRLQAQSEPYICDNGGFEDDFTYYLGFVGSFFSTGLGSSSCNPTLGGTPIGFTGETMPSTYKFQIVTAGLDPVVGVNQVRFGTKALMINSYCSHLNSCNHRGEVNKVTKTFRVNEGNRDFTIWYCAILENPDHPNQQPFFSIRCDLAVSDDLCYDGVSFPGKQKSRPLLTCNGNDTICFNENDYVKYTDWACHRIHIPEDEIGEIATLEFTAPDCAPGGHFGYVYIDGICQDCDSSSYGSGTLNTHPNILVSCDRDSITISGRYTTPTISGYTILDSIYVTGFNIYGLSIDTVNKTFSFRIIKSDFQSPNDTCRDVIAYLKFKNSNNDYLPDVPTNSIYICYDDFLSPEVDVNIGDCYRNHPTNNIASDDYYYVDVEITNSDYIYWVLERQIDEPYPNKSGHYVLKSNGYGNGNYKLGPFMIQDGSWILILNHNHCSDTFQINPPDYCSGCSQLGKTKISNVTCTQGNEWSFDINVPITNPPQGAYFRINSLMNQFSFNMTHTIDVGSIGVECPEFTITYIDPPNTPCPIKFRICPPKKCTDNPNCEIEAYVTKLNCIESGASYSCELDVSGGGYICYQVIGTSISGSFSNPLGPFTSDITLALFTCSTPYSCSCWPNTNCYKLIYISKPEDCDRDDFGGSENQLKSIVKYEVTIAPNPVLLNEFFIFSNLEKTEFELYHTSGKKIYSGNFEGPESRIQINLVQGVYYLRYKNESGMFQTIKFTKI